MQHPIWFEPSDSDHSLSSSQSEEFQIKPPQGSHLSDECWNCPYQCPARHLRSSSHRIMFHCGKLELMERKMRETNVSTRSTALQYIAKSLGVPVTCRDPFTMVQKKVGNRELNDAVRDALIASKCQCSAAWRLIGMEHKRSVLRDDFPEYPRVIPELPAKRGKFSHDHGILRDEFIPPFQSIFSSQSPFFDHRSTPPQSPEVSPRANVSLPPLISSSSQPTSPRLPSLLGSVGYFPAPSGIPSSFHNQPSYHNHNQHSFHNHQASILPPLSESLSYQQPSFTPQLRFFPLHPLPPSPPPPPQLRPELELLAIDLLSQRLELEDGV